MLVHMNLMAVAVPHCLSFSRLAAELIWGCSLEQESLYLSFLIHLWHGNLEMKVLKHPRT